MKEFIKLIKYAGERVDGSLYMYFINRGLGMAIYWEIEFAYGSSRFFYDYIIDKTFGDE